MGDVGRDGEELWLRSRQILGTMGVWRKSWEVLEERKILGTKENRGERTEREGATADYNKKRLRKHDESRRGVRDTYKFNLGGYYYLPVVIFLWGIIDEAALRALGKSLHTIYNALISEFLGI